MTTKEQLIEAMAPDELARVSAKLGDIYTQYVRESAAHPETFADMMEYLVAAINDAGFCILPRDHTDEMAKAFWKDGRYFATSYKAMIEAGKL